MKEEFVTYEIAKKLKEKGFNEPCLASYRWGKFMPHKKEILGESEYIDEDISISYKSLLRNGEESLGIIAPIISQVLKWLRKEKNLSVEPYSCACGWRVTICKTGNVLEGYVSGGTCVKDEVKGHNDGGAFDWYEQAALAGIEYVIDNLI